MRAAVIRQQANDVACTLTEWLFEDGARRLHLIEAGRLIASADTDASALPSRPGLLGRFAEGAFGRLDELRSSITTTRRRAGLCRQRASLAGSVPCQRGSGGGRR